jgi:hypothetical protein
MNDWHQVGFIDGPKQRRSRLVDALADAVESSLSAYGLSLAAVGALLIGIVINVIYAVLGNVGVLSPGWVLGATAISSTIFLLWANNFLRKSRLKITETRQGLLDGGMKEQGDGTLTIQRSELGE